MNKALLSLIAILAVVGCEKSDEEATTRTPAPATPKRATPIATPKRGDWMWNAPKGTPKGTSKAVNPLSIPDDPFAPKTKK